VFSIMRKVSIDVTSGKETDTDLDGGLPPTPTPTSSRATVDARGVVIVDGAELDIGSDAYVVTKNGKSHVLGNRASVRCNVGSAWLPLEACD
jgi:hypothetical protein